jgi:arylsulfatase A-like enzyme
LPVLLQASCGRASGPPCAVLITLDTTRADAVGAFGGRPGVTPNLDRLARESVVYARARTVAPVTLPAHASMWTGLYPLRHGVRDNNLVALPDSATTVAECARDDGFQTAAFVSASVLDGAWGLDQGFETYDAPLETAGDGPGEGGERSAAKTVSAARRWLAARDLERPYLLWVHLFDPHSPYVPDARSRIQAGGDAYLGEVAAADRAVGELLHAIRSDPAYDRTTILVLGDHGESLGEHGEPTHSVLCYRATIDIPFLVRHPDGRRAGERPTDLVSAVDVAPTLAEALHLRFPAGLDGSSLVHGAPPSDRGVYFESYVGFLHYGWSPIAGWESGHFKVLMGGGTEVFDTAEDPMEMSNRAASRAEEISSARARIAELGSRPRLAPLVLQPIAEGLRARVRSLGYAGGAEPADGYPDPLDESPGPPARDRMAELVEYYAVVERARVRTDSLDELRSFVAAHPGNLAALDMLGALLSSRGRCEEAIGYLERYLASGRERVTTHTNLGVCHEALGDLNSALEHFRRAEIIEPGAPDRVRHLIRVLEALGRIEEAETWRSRSEGTAANPTSISPRAGE